MDQVTVIKRNPEGKETWRYTGEVRHRSGEAILLTARFNRPDLPFHGILLAEGDLFVEIFFTNRWYNIFEIHAHQDNSLKGWYCNVTRPAEFLDGEVSYIDLALDLLVYADGRQLVLDEDEFEALGLNEQVQREALAALAELQQLFKPAGQVNLWEAIRKQEPFSFPK